MEPKQEPVVLTKSRMVAMSLGPTAAQYRQGHFLMENHGFASIEHLEGQCCESLGSAVQRVFPFEQLSNLENLKESALQKLSDSDMRCLQCL